MQAQSRIEFLARVDFLAGAPRELLERIARDVERIEAVHGTEILVDEEPGDDMYFIVEGEVRVEKKGQALLTRRGGEYVGEMALVDSTPRSAAAVAATDVVLLRWKKDAFQETLATNGRVAYQVCQAFSRKIRESVESIAALKQDRERAVQLQRAMLPPGTFRNGIVELAASCIQADEIGGDYFDYLPFDDDQVALVVADAEGHGFPAALLVAMLKTQVHSRAARDRDPGRVMAALNQTLAEQIDVIRMATCIYVLLDASTHELRFCNAGHIPQYHYRADTDELETLASENFILGFEHQDGSVFQTATSSWKAGDLLVLCTDGVTEAESPEGEEFGARRLGELVLRYKDREPEEIRQKLLEGLRSFHGGETFNDDVTLLVARLC